MKATVTKAEKVVLYKPQISIGAANKYDLILHIEWGVTKKTVKLSREAANLIPRIVDEINLALQVAADAHPYETR